jgi:hypothetical protein
MSAADGRVCALDRTDTKGASEMPCPQARAVNAGSRLRDDHARARAGRTAAGPLALRRTEDPPLICAERSGRTFGVIPYGLNFVRDALQTKIFCTNENLFRFPTNVQKSC